MTLEYRSDRSEHYYRCRGGAEHRDGRVSATKGSLFYQRRSSVVITMRVLFRLMNKDKPTTIYNDLSLSRNSIAQVYEDMIAMFDSDFCRNNPIQLGKFIYI